MKDPFEIQKPSNTKKKATTSKEVGIKDPFIVEQNNSNVKFDDIVSKWKSSNDPVLQVYGQSLEKIGATLDDKNSTEVRKVLLLLSKSKNYEEISKYVDELSKIARKFEDNKTGENNSTLASTVALSGSQNILDDTITLLGENVETVKEMYDKVKKSFGETGVEILKNWEVNDKGDVEIINAIFASLLDVGGLALLDIIWDVGVVDLGVKIGLKDILFLLKNGIQLDVELFKTLGGRAFDRKDGSSIFILALFIIFHINYGYGAWLRFRDYIVSTRGEKDSKKDKTKEKKKITDENGKVTYEEKVVESKMYKLFGKYYLDAVTTQPIIFDVNDNLSSEANEYIKRKRAIEALKSFFYDDPKILNELKLIENSSLQSNTIRYWRRLWRLLEGHGFLRKFVERGVIPEFAKREKEAVVLDFIEEKQKEQQKTLELLYETNDGKVDTNKKTKFLEGLYNSINNNPNLTKQEKILRISNLEKLLNQVTSSRLIDKDRLVQELYRIEKGYLTKIEALDIVQEELDKIDKEEAGKKTSKSKWIKNKLLLRKYNLKRLRNKIANGTFDGITREELKKEIENIKGSKIVYFIKKRFLKFPKTDEFIENIETEYGKIEKKLDLYDGEKIKDPKNLENFIKYILSGEDEDKVKKVLEDFLKTKTPYEKLAFYRELNRIKERFLPSNQLLENLMEIREEIIKEIEKKNKLKKSGYIKATLNYLKNLSIKLENNSNWENIDNSVKQNLKQEIKLISNQLKIGQFTEAYETFKRIGAELKKISKLEFNNFIDFFKNKKIIFENNNIRNIKDTRIEKLDKIIELAREGKLNIYKENIKQIKTDLESFYRDINKYISKDFTEAKQEALIEELKKYEGLDEYDYKTELGLSEKSSTIEIENALEEKFKFELLYTNLLNEAGENLGDIRSELKKFANLINKNNLTRGQSLKIIERIFKGKKIDISSNKVGLLDIDYITRNVTDHTEKNINIEGKLKKKLRQIFEGNDEVKKNKILRYIDDNKNIIDESKLPDFIKNYKEKKKEQEKTIEEEKKKLKEIERQKEELNSMIEKIKTRRNITQLEKLEEIFDEYIRKEKIDRQNPEFKDLIEEFEGEYNRKYEEFDSSKKPKKKKKKKTKEKQNSSSETKETTKENRKQTLIDLATNNDPEYQRLFEEASEKFELRAILDGKNSSDVEFDPIEGIIESETNPIYNEELLKDFAKKLNIEGIDYNAVKLALENSSQKGQMTKRVREAGKTELEKFWEEAKKLGKDFFKEVKKR